MHARITILFETGLSLIMLVQKMILGSSHITWIHRYAEWCTAGLPGILITHPTVCWTIVIILVAAVTLLILQVVLYITC